MLKIIGVDLRDDGRVRDFGPDGLIDRGLRKVLCTTAISVPAARVHAQPFVFEGAGETDQRDECADGHRDSAQRQQRPQPPAPEVLPGESREGQFRSHVNRISPRDRRIELNLWASVPAGARNVHRPI